MYFYNGDRYEGSWKNDKRNGEGTYYYQSGAYYKGSWVDDQKEGKGIFDWKDGSKYEGYWVEDKEHGHGKFVSANGDVYDGEWAGGEMNGEGIMRLSDGTKFNLSASMRQLPSELYSAALGQGATLNGKPIHVSGTANIDHALICMGYPYDAFNYMPFCLGMTKALYGHCASLRSFGSAESELCYLAAGR